MTDRPGKHPIVFTDLVGGKPTPGANAARQRWALHPSHAENRFLSLNTVPASSRWSLP